MRKIDTLNTGSAVDEHVGKASPTDVRDAKVLLMMVGGRIVHDGRTRRSDTPLLRASVGFAVPGPL